MICYTLSILLYHPQIFWHYPYPWFPAMNHIVWRLCVVLDLSCNHNLSFHNCIRLCIPGTRSTWSKRYLVQCVLSHGSPQPIFWLMLLWEKTIHVLQFDRSSKTKQINKLLFYFYRGFAFKTKTCVIPQSLLCMAKTDLGVLEDWQTAFWRNATLH